MSISLNGLTFYLTLLHSEAPSLSDSFTSSCPRARGLVPPTRIVSPCFARTRFQLGLSSRAPQALNQTSSINTIHPVMACIHHAVNDSTVRYFTSFNCASMRHPLNQLGPNSTSFLQLGHVVSLLRNCSLASNSAVSFTPDAQELRFLDTCCEQASKLQSSVSTLQTWLMCLLSSNNRACHLHHSWHISLHHNKHVYHSIKELHLWNLHCRLNCLDGRHLASHHHWHFDDSVDDTHRDTLLEE